VVVGYRQAEVRQALASSNVTFVDQGEPLGTGHAVQVCRPVVDQQTNRAFLVYGDTPFLTARTLTAVSATLNDPSVSCALVTTRKTAETERFGRIVRRGNDLAAIVEYKNATDAERAIDEVNVGGYCARLPWLWQALEQVARNPLTGEYYLTDIVKIAIDAGRRVVPVMVDPAEAHGIDTPELLAFVQRARSVDCLDS
jgi:bifunctional N-acetylglucosamine-1-phosphate-uridyltransferase/glucosamine-1-phosphate-acetyltransferase GlmU-like protein